MKNSASSFLCASYGSCDRVMRCKCQNVCLFGNDIKIGTIVSKTEHFVQVKNGEVDKVSPSLVIFRGIFPDEVNRARIDGTLTMLIKVRSFRAHVTRGRAPNSACGAESARRAALGWIGTATGRGWAQALPAQARRPRSCQGAGLVARVRLEAGAT